MRPNICTVLLVVVGAACLVFATGRITRAYSVEPEAEWLGTAAHEQEGLATTQTSASSITLDHLGALARAVIDERRLWVAQKDSAHWHDWGLFRHPADLWASYVPYYTCARALTKRPSIAVLADGGKWMCGLKELRQLGDACVVYSVGSEGKFDFEETVRQVAPNCAIHVFDCTCDDAKAGDYYTYHKLCVAGATEMALHPERFPSDRFETLPSIMRRLGHTHLSVLKMDAEGAEFSVVLDGDVTRANVSQFAVEIHPAAWQGGLGKGQPMTMPDLERFIATLEQEKLYLTMLEPVCTHCPNQREALFVREDWNQRLLMTDR